MANDHSSGWRRRLIRMLDTYADMLEREEIREKYGSPPVVTSLEEGVATCRWFSPAQRDVEFGAKLAEALLEEKVRYDVEAWLTSIGMVWE